MKERERNEEPETMKPILSLLFLLTESQFVIEPEDITAGQNDPAILICAGRDGGEYEKIIVSYFFD